MPSSEAQPATNSPRRVARGVILLGALVVGAIFLWNVRELWFQSDDAFISFRYARNLVDGLGLVWNAGERVEGYTNFSWVLLIAAGMRLGLSPEVFSNVLGALAGALLVAAALRFAARQRPLGSRWPWLFAGLLVMNQSFSAWCTGGLETMLFALLVFLGFSSLLGTWGRRGALRCAALFGAAALTRPEGVFFGGLAFLILCLEVVQRRRELRQLVAWLVPFAGVVAAHLLWRRAYYGDWVPNTFHAKVSGAWFEQGRRYFAYFHGCYWIGWFLPLGVFAFLGPNRRTALTLAFVVAAHWMYLLTIGGDIFELRFIVHSLPLLYWLLVEGLAVLGGPDARKGTFAARDVFGRLVTLALVFATVTGFERVSGNAYGLQTIDGIKQYTLQRIDQGRFLRAQIEEGKLPDDLVLCVGGAGAVPYYTGWPTVDRRGLSDAFIAHLPAPERGLVGHERDAPWDYLVERKVVVFDYYNQLLVKVRGLPQLRGPYRHDGRKLRMRAVPLGERALVFATFVGEAELARIFAGLRILVLPLK